MVIKMLIFLIISKGMLAPKALYSSNIQNRLIAMDKDRSPKVNSLRKKISIHLKGHLSLSKYYRIDLEINIIIFC